MIYGWILLVYYYRMKNSELLIMIYVACCFMSVAGEQGRCLLSTQPKILFCDLELAPGESRTCKCTCAIAVIVFVYAEIF